MKYRYLISVLFLTWIAVFAISGSNPILAQKGQEKRVREIPAPESENFSPVGEILAPWRISQCALRGVDNLNRYCFGTELNGDDFLKASVVTLYNTDGTIWEKIELNHKEPNYFLKVEIKGFVPFALNSPYDPDGIFLRMVGESAHWYEVEINENTRATKFALRDDKAWTRTKWDGWLYRMRDLYLSPNHPPLQEAPNGKIIAASESIKFEHVKFLKADGDWAYVEGVANPGMPNPDIYIGWIQWREGRKILVGCIFNNHKPPE